MSYGAILLSEKEVTYLVSHIKTAVFESIEEAGALPGNISKDTVKLTQ